MKMKNWITLGLIGVMAMGCGPSETKGTNESEKTEDRTEEVAELERQSKETIGQVLTAEDFQLPINPDGKWVVPDTTYYKLMQIKKYLYLKSGGMDTLEVVHYNDLAAEFNAFISTIPVPESEGEKDFVKQIIDATNVQCVFMAGSDLKQAQIAFVNMNVLYESLPNYLESKD